MMLSKAHLLRRILTVLSCLIISPAFAAEGGGHGAQGIPVKAVLFAAINFAILLFILGYFLRKPVKEFFASRAALIRKDIGDSEALKNQAEKKYREYESRLARIEQETGALIGQLKQDGQLEKARLMQTAQDQIQALQATSQRIMGHELQRAKEELKKEAVQLAAQLAEDLVRQNITAEDQRRLVKTYLEKMEGLS
jgi:F-type H+-transporting ATPase subunit b